MGHELIKHAGDVRLHVWGETLEGLFKDGVSGLMHVLNPNVQIAPSQKKSVRVIRLEAPDLTALFLGFMGKVLANAYTHNETYSEVSIRELSGNKLVAEIHGVRVHALEANVKAVTYHSAQLKKNAKGEFEVTCGLNMSTSGPGSIYR